MAPDSKITEEPLQSNEPGKQEHKTQVVWRNAFLFAYLHLAALYGGYLALTSASWKTTLFAIILGSMSELGITAGAHRLWSHRSYKARWPLRVFLCILNTVAFQNDIYEWCRDHRVHHKHTETNADPHNIKRGFFFAHMGWLMCKKHPDVAAKGKTLNLDDLWDDPIVRFQRRFYLPLVISACFILPTMIPYWCWGETLWNSFFVAAIARYCSTLNNTWLVNSVAHKFGNKPFDKDIEARESPFVSFFAIGEGWHNYHHVFPWDYSTSELGYTINFTKLFIDFMAMIGLAYDLKTAHPGMVKSKKLKYGDGTRLNPHDEQEDALHAQ